MAIEHTIDTPLARVCREVGSQSRLARLVGKTQATVHQRLREGKAIWPESVLAIEEATGISRYEQRADIYGPDPAEIAGSLAAKPECLS